MAAPAAPMDRPHGRATTATFGGIPRVSQPTKTSNAAAEPSKSTAPIRSRAAAAAMASFNKLSQQHEKGANVNGGVKRPIPKANVRLAASNAAKQQQQQQQQQRQQQRTPSDTSLRSLPPLSGSAVTSSSNSSLGADAGWRRRRRPMQQRSVTTSSAAAWIPDEDRGYEAADERPMNGRGAVEAAKLASIRNTPTIKTNVDQRSGSGSIAPQRSLSDNTVAKFRESANAAAKNSVVLEQERKAAAQIEQQRQLEEQEAVRRRVEEIVAANSTPLRTSSGVPQAEGSTTGHDDGWHTQLGFAIPSRPSFAFDQSSIEHDLEEMPLAAARKLRLSQDGVNMYSSFNQPDGLRPPAGFGDGNSAIFHMSDSEGGARSRKGDAGSDSGGPLIRRHILSSPLQIDFKQLGFADSASSDEEFFDADYRPEAVKSASDLLNLSPGQTSLFQSKQFSSSTGALPQNLAAEKSITSPGTPDTRELGSAREGALQPALLEFAAKKAAAKANIDNKANAALSPSENFKIRARKPVKPMLLKSLRKIEDDSKATNLDPGKKGKEYRAGHQHPHLRSKAAIKDDERRRYEGLWATNKGYWISDAVAQRAILATENDAELSNQESDSNPTETDDVSDAFGSSYGGGSYLRADSMPKAVPTQDLVSCIVVRELWRRSNLPDEQLSRIWTLVDRRKCGALDREEFIVGTWFVDQCLRGKKLPPRQISPQIWASVRWLNPRMKAFKPPKEKKKRKLQVRRFIAL